MTDNNFLILALSAASIGFFHTALGPDHYLPFVALSKIKNWTLKKTLSISFLCGLGRIGSSVILGFLGVFLGLGLNKINLIQNFRGQFAGWLLIAFGFFYFAWGIKNVLKNKTHTHLHNHPDITHTHDHSHVENHVHLHETKENYLSPLILFIIFVFGPCETLIPLLIYPAAQLNFFSIFFIIILFSLSTIATMFVMITLSYFGLRLIPLKQLHKYSHALAGFSIFLSGVAINFLGL